MSDRASRTTTTAREQLLFVTPWLPVASGSGGQIVSHGLQRLYQTQVSVDLIFGEDESAPLGTPPPGVSVVGSAPLRLRYGSNRLYTAATAARTWVMGRSMRAAKLATRPMRRVVTCALAAKFYDFVHVDLTLLAGAVPDQVRSLIVSAQNIEVEVMQRLMVSSAHLPRRTAAAIEAWATAREERRQLSRAAAVIAMSDRDARVLSELYDIDRNAIIPVYPYVRSEDVKESPPPQGRDVLILGSLASPGRAEGVVWFVERVWPAVSHAVPDAVLHIIGSSPPAKLRRHVDASVRIHGFVPSVEPYRRRARAVAVPLFAGGGIRVKIIEALSWRLPVVTTTIGAAGLHDDTSQFITVTDDAGHMASSIITALTDDAWFCRVVERGGEHVQQRYSWAAARRAIGRVLDVARGRAVETGRT